MPTTNERHSLSALLPVVCVFVVLLGIMWWGFDTALYNRSHPNRDLLAAPQSSGPVVLEAGRVGHYRVPGTINGEGVHFLIDTGASAIAIPRSIARELHIHRGPRITVRTAAGPTSAYLTRLDTVVVGSIVQHDVRAAIVPGMRGGPVLLGMSFLDNVSMVKRGDQLILRERP